MIGSRFIAVAGLAVLIAGCQTNVYPSPPPPDYGRPPPVVVRPPPGPGPIYRPPPPGPGPIVRPPGPGPIAGRCDARRARFAVGNRISNRLVAEAQDRARARTVRVIQPGQAVTFDYRDDRLNIEIGRGQRVVRVACG